MPQDLSEIVKQLNQVGIFDYFRKKSMPDFVEPYVKEIVERFKSCSDAERNHLLSLISRESPVFGWYARKLAGRAARENSQKDLRNGLMALVIDANKADFRDVMSPLALLHRNALRLQEDPKALFDAISESLTPQARSLLGGFLRRPPEQRPIQAFGFSEGLGPHGFDYVPLLPEYGGQRPSDPTWSNHACFQR